jgi:hypothetical protein
MLQTCRSLKKGFTSIPLAFGHDDNGDVHVPRGSWSIWGIIRVLAETQTNSIDNYCMGLTRIVLVYYARMVLSVSYAASRSNSSTYCSNNHAGWRPRRVEMVARRTEALRIWHGNGCIWREETLNDESKLLAEKYTDI